MAIRPKRVEVNGQVYLRTLTAGQMRDNERKLGERRKAWVDAKPDSEEEAAAYEALYDMMLEIVSASIVGMEDEQGSRVDFDADKPFAEQIDGADMQELARHLCGDSTTGAVQVVGQSPLAE